MVINRRNFLRTAGVSFAALSIMNNPLFSNTKSKIAGVGMCDWNLGGTADPDCIPKAKEAHLEGIQVSVGENPNSIPLRDPDVRKKYIELGKTHNITFSSVAAGGILNSIPLATEPQSAVYVIDAVEAAAALGAKNILIAFFGSGDLRLRGATRKFRERKENGYSYFDLDTKAVKRVVEALRQIAPRAEDAGIALGIENTLTAKQNLEIIDGIGSKIAQVYYDVGNSWGNGYNVPEEIRMLGNDRICEVHLKDWNTPMLGSEGCMVDMVQCAEALKDIGYDKWLVLETSGRKDKFIEDTRTNVAFTKNTFM